MNGYANNHDFSFTWKEIATSRVNFNVHVKRQIPCAISATKKTPKTPANKGLQRDCNEIFMAERRILFDFIFAYGYFVRPAYNTCIIMRARLAQKR